MEIAIFKELTTTEHLNQLKKESEKYTGLYVDMEDKKQRKYVKDKAADIKTLIAKIERRRIDTVAEYKIDVEKEAASITEDLVIANLPFTLLIDDYAIARKVILDEEKARKLAIEAAVKFEADHEFALLMDSKIDADRLAQKAAMEKYEAEMKAEAAAEAKAEAESIAKENEQRIEREKQEAIQREEQAKQAQANAERDAIAAKEREKQAAEQAEAQRKQAEIDAESNRLEAIEQAKQTQIKAQKDKQEAEIAEAKRREADKKYMGGVHRAILKVLTDNGINEKDGKTMIKLAATAQLPQLTINY